MITSLRVVSLLFLLFYFTETRSESCGSVQKCIRCGCLSMSPQSQRVQCNQTLKCDILNMTDTELVIACDEPDDCEEIVVEDGFSCFSRVHYSETSDKWQFVTGYATYRENCDLVGCPPPGGFTTELDEIESQVFDCHCFTNNCNRFRNVNVTQEMMQTSTDSSLMPIHTTTIGSSVIRSHVVFQSNIIMSMYPTSLFNRSILLMDSTSEPNNTAQSAEDSTAVFISIIAVLFVVMSVIFVLMLFTVCYLYRRLLSKRNQHSMNHVVQLHSNDPTSSDVANQSEHDFPFTILETIGYGRFGTVCCAIYGNATVAVKVYNSSHRAKWRKEKHIYSFESTPHENLLHCISFGQRDDGQRKQPYRISENYVLGSLDCFLKRNILSWYQTLNILHDISCGLVHLHSNKYVREGTTKDKLAVAHRDLKSANVLVKDTSGHCVLSDLGQGLVIDPLKDENEISTEQVWVSIMYELLGNCLDWCQYVNYPPESPKL